MNPVYCKICNNLANFIQKAVILNKYEAKYFYCNFCGFVQVEGCEWLEEAYSDAINDSDIGLISRNLNLSLLTYYLIKTFFDQKSSFLDYGSGYGVFVRLMRDRGIDFFGFDPYCENIFAKTFDKKYSSNNQYELLTAFELFEHLTNPLQSIEEMLKYSKNIFFTTLIVPDSTPEPEKWWYYGLEHGQHVSFYSIKSLRYISNKYKLNFYSDNKFLHIFTENKINYKLFIKIAKPKILKLFDIIFPVRSKLEDDYKIVMEIFNNKKNLNK